MKTVTFRDVVDVLKALPPHRLMEVYDFARFVRQQEAIQPALADELAMWEQAGMEDWVKFEAALEPGGVVQVDNPGQPMLMSAVKKSTN